MNLWAISSWHPSSISSLPRLRKKRRVADYIDAIMTHIISNDYYFLDYDGKPTLWGRWNPDYVNSFAETQFDRRLNSTLTIAGLQLAYKLTSKEIYKREAFRMMEEHGYQNMKIPMKNIRFARDSSTRE